MCCVTSRVLQSRSLLLPICITQTELLPEIVSLWILHPSISKMLYENPAFRLFQDNVPHFIQFVHEILCGSCSQVSTNWSVWSLHVIFKMAQGRNCIQTFIRCLCVHPVSWLLQNDSVRILHCSFFKMVLCRSFIQMFSRWLSAISVSRLYKMALPGWCTQAAKKYLFTFNIADFSR